MKKIHFKYLPILLIAILILLWVVDISNPKIRKNTLKIENNKNLQEISGIFTAIDGDSLRIKNGQEIRLLEIDAPEYNQTCFDKNDKEYGCGRISAKFLKKLTKNIQLTCKYRKKDIYDRYLAICFAGDKNINYQMIKNGMAIIYNIHNASDEIKSLEKQARNGRVGLWQGKFLTQKEFRKISKNEK